ncbi:MAG: hypothetical protein J0L80_01870 [Chitinophagales bacterium]|nr:hypothetical protein [Chitinophagales bacterium]
MKKHRVNPFLFLLCKEIIKYEAEILFPFAGDSRISELFYATFKPTEGKFKDSRHSSPISKRSLRVYNEVRGFRKNVWLVEDDFYFSESHLDKLVRCITIYQKYKDWKSFVFAHCHNTAAQICYKHYVNKAFSKYSDNEKLLVKSWVVNSFNSIVRELHLKGQSTLTLSMTEATKLRSFCFKDIEHQKNNESPILPQKTKQVLLQVNDWVGYIKVDKYEIADSYLWLLPVKSKFVERIHMGFLDPISAKDIYKKVEIKACRDFLIPQIICRQLEQVDVFFYDIIFAINYPSRGVEDINFYIIGGLSSEMDTLISKANFVFLREVLTVGNTLLPMYVAKHTQLSMNHLYMMEF